MNKPAKFDIFSSYTKVGQKFFGVAVFAVILFVLIGEAVAPSESDVTQEECRVFESSWQQILENGDRVPVEYPGQIPAEYGEVIALTTTLPDDICKGQNLCFRTVWQDVDIYIGGELRRSYNTKDTRPFGINSAFRYVFVELKEADSGKELVYEFSSKSKYAGRTYTCYIGDKAGIWGYLVKESGMRTVVVVFLLLMSSFCIFVCFILKLVYKRALPLRNLAWALFLCASWMLSEIEFRQTIFRNVSVLTNLTYWSLILIPITLTLYINEVQQGYYQKLFSITIIYNMVMFVIGTILQVFDIVQFVSQLPFIHTGVLLAIVSIIVTITIDTFNKRIAEYLSVGVGLYGMLITAVLEMILYYIGYGTSLGTVLAIGLVFLLIMAIIKTGQDLLLTEKNRQQAIAAREAQAQFLANMSHEIRTPINAVIGMNEMILRESSDKAIREYAKNIQSASNMLLGLVNDVLDFSKIESGQMELVEDTYNLAAVIKDESVLLNARAAGKAISTKIDVDPDIPSKLYGDELRIKQVLTNLLSNAVKYTKEGTVTLKVFYRWMDAETIEIFFAVKDTGIGVKKEDLSKLFDSFKRLEMNKNRNIEGTGLGLNIAKQLVTLMNGDITVESQYGKGSTFTIAIPQKVMDRQPIGNLEEAMRECRTENAAEEKIFKAPDAKVLVVDDNAMNLSLMKELLKRTQMQVDLAASGKECLTLCKEKTYDIILMDHMMPELDGVETLHLLRENHSNPNQNTVVIALTANAGARSREMYLEYGFNDYFTKPIQAAKLDELLVTYLPEKLVQMEKSLKNEKEVTVEQTEATDEQTPKEQQSEEDLLYIDRETGISYCLDSEKMYYQVLASFCKQAKEYLPQLDEYFKNRNWKQYAIIAHGLKSNSLNIGAANFSKLSLEHELAAKSENEEFIAAEYERYIDGIKNLVCKAEEILKGST